jgi:DNA-binding MarR family transcriptional regulator
MISMSKLAQTITVSNQQLTRIADELEKSGLVAREQNPENRRQTLIRLTESGKKLLVEHRRMIHSMLEDRLAQLDEQDLPDVLESIQTIRRAFSKIL